MPLIKSKASAYSAKVRKGLREPTNYLKEFQKTFHKYCGSDSKPIKRYPNVIDGDEMTAYLFFTYIFVGCMYYITTNSLEFLGNPGEPANVTFLEAVYFLFVTMFTVGYGDFYPGTVECQIATIFIATLGVMVTSTGLSVVANFIIDMRDDLIEHTRALAIKNGGESKAVDIDAALQTGPRKLGTGYSGPWYRRAYQVFVDVRRAWPILDGLAYLWAYLIATGAFWIWFQRLRYPAADQFTSLVDGLYFVFITGASVGYGDVGVVGRDGWALMIFFIPLTCAFVSTQLNEITKMFISDKLSAKLDSLMKCDLSLEAMLKMDGDGDGSITEFEFLKFMLTKSGVVEASVLDALHTRFREMDVDGSGVLTKGDMPIAEPLGGTATVPASLVELTAKSWKALYRQSSPLAARRAFGHLLHQRVVDEAAEARARHQEPCGPTPTHGSTLGAVAAGPPPPPPSFPPPPPPPLPFRPMLPPPLGTSDSTLSRSSFSRSTSSNGSDDGSAWDPLIRPKPPRPAAAAGRYLIPSAQASALSLSGRPVGPSAEPRPRQASSEDRVIVSGRASAESPSVSVPRRSQPGLPKVNKGAHGHGPGGRARAKAPRLSRNPMQNTVVARQAGGAGAAVSASSSARALSHGGSGAPDRHKPSTSPEEYELV